MAHPADWKRAASAWDYIWRCVERSPRIPYGWWLSGDVPSEAPAWADNHNAPSVANIDSMFCAAVGNLMIRGLGMWDEGYVIPGEGNPQYDGGTVGWVAYYRSYGTLEDFDEEFAANHSGTVCLREFRDANADQGHWMVTWKGWAIQTFPPDGLNWDYTVGQSHDGGYYEYMVKPWNWLPITEDEYFSGGSGGGGTTSTALTPPMLTRAMTSNSFAGPDADPDTMAEYFPYVRKTLHAYGITNRARLSAFLAQTGTESGSWRWWREFSRGEGKPFGEWYGRGPIQLTWEENYSQFEEATHWLAHQNKELVADDVQCGFDSAGWFWQSRGLNELADVATWQAFYEITGRVYGEAGPVAERDNRYQVAWDALPAGLTIPATDGPPPPPPTNDPPTFSWLAVDGSGWHRQNGDDCTGGWFDTDMEFVPRRWSREKGYF